MIESILISVSFLIIVSLHCFNVGRLFLCLETSTLHNIALNIVDCARDWHYPGWQIDVLLTRRVTATPPLPRWLLRCCNPPSMIQTGRLLSFQWRQRNFLSNINNELYVFDKDRLLDEKNEKTIKTFYSLDSLFCVTFFHIKF